MAKIFYMYDGNSLGQDMPQKDTNMIPEHPNLNVGVEGQRDYSEAHGVERNDTVSP